MDTTAGNYARHAPFWDWGGHDRAPENAYWLDYAARYGTYILLPMCALGETGAYMAKNGCTVTAFDLTPEMIAEGQKRFGDIPGLRLCIGDVTDFHFDIPPVDFCFSMDFGHLTTIEQVKKALSCIHRHLRVGGGLVIETGLLLPDVASDYTPLQTFYPQRPVYPGLKVWKTGKTRNDAETGRCYITQTFYTEDESGHTDRFEHAFYLQSYTREAWLTAFAECGYDIVGTYSSRALASWQSGGSGFCIFEAVKR